MNLNNVKLIFAREMRDQLRDRRTLFLIAVLPLLLYPLLGMSFFQLSQFLRHHAAQVMVVGAEELEELAWLPRLLDEEQFHPTLFTSPNERASLKVVFPQAGQVSESDSETQLETAPTEQPAPLELAQESLNTGVVQVVVHFPRGFGQRLLDARQALLSREPPIESEESTELPEPQIFYNSANEKSRVAQLRVERVLRNWRNDVMRTNLRDSKVPLNAAQPFELQPQDVAEEQHRHAAVWAKILPFILFIWALTGAFYPAVDLCAGEKERGTLETLLVSPAQRREIVWGKLLTIMSFSVVTALLNLGSMGITANFVLDQFREINAFRGEAALSLPPLISVVWLAVALLPIAALFSALCLACAAFARSTKEGQYYLMPLLLVIMPLMLLPLSPGVELNLGNSLIPVTGVVLLLRSIIEGQYWHALPYVIPVVGVTLICCLLAIRWAEEQFNSESVLFRESERLDLGRWLVHLVRDRTETPTFAQSLLCIVAIMVVQFFVNLASASSASELVFPLLARTVFISQLACILFPAMLMALLFTRNLRKTLMLDHMPKPSHLAVAALMAFLMFPLGQQFALWIQQLYPYTPEVSAQVTGFAETLQSAPYWWMPILLIAILPAFCEEIAFRGFILSGLRHLGHKWWAIGFSAVAFGMVHFFLQQKISAAAVGLVIGLIAVQTSSLIPCIIFHALYNGLTLIFGEFAESLNEELTTDSPWAILLRPDGEGLFQPWVLVICLFGVAACCWWLHRQPYLRSDEEQLQEAREQQLVGA